MTLRAHAKKASPPKAAARRSDQAAIGPEPSGHLPGSLSSVPGTVQRKCPECEAAETRTAISPRLEVGPADDPYEREADGMAAQVMAMREPGAHSAISSGTNVQRRCASCQADDAVHAKSDAPAASGGESLAASAGQLTSGGRPMPGPTQDFFSSRFGHDFSGVRVHDGPQSDALNSSISARAFTYGNHIWLSRRERAEPSFTMAHELAHVVQQTGGRARPRRIQRLVHGPSTPTNCHNWQIGLPPWIAGSLAHIQANVYFARNPGSAGRILPEVTMPRGTKTFMGIPDPGRFTGGNIPPGFVDTVGVRDGSVGFGEIKSTASADLAEPQARHYLARHTEWMARAPWSDTLDLSYGTVIGGPKAGTLLSGLGTGSDALVGPFIGDPLKELHVEADNFGAICYWCTGFGMVNPALARALQQAFRAVIDAFWAAYRTIKETIDDLVDWIGDNPVLAFVILLLLVVIGIILAILGGLLEVPSLGTSTPVTLGGAALALSAALAILVLLGVDTSGIEPPSRELAAVMTERARTDTPSGSDYERDADQGRWSSTVATYRAGQEEVYQNFVAGLSSVPGTLTSAMLDYLNPLSDTVPPTPNASTLAFASGWADRLSQSSDARVSELGNHAQRIAGGITV